jgi:hypothetical protein
VTLKQSYEKGVTAAFNKFGLALPNLKVKAPVTPGGNFFQQQYQHGKNFFSGIDQSIMGAPGGTDKLWASAKGLLPTAGIAGGAMLLPHLLGGGGGGGGGGGDDRR